jgi:hypothetical protein
MENMSYEKFTESTADQAELLLDSLNIAVRTRSRMALAVKDTLLGLLRSGLGEKELGRLRDMNYNENLYNVVLNRLNTNKIYDAGKKYIQRRSYS